MTGDELKAHMVARNLRKVRLAPCQTCSFVRYYIRVTERGGESLYYTPECSCRWRPTELISWDAAAVAIDADPTLREAFGL
jgi:hypothetical protein